MRSSSLAAILAGFFLFLMVAAGFLLLRHDGGGQQIAIREQPAVVPRYVPSPQTPVPQPSTQRDRNNVVPDNRDRYETSQTLPEQNQSESSNRMMPNSSSTDIANEAQVESDKNRPNRESVKGEKTNVESEKLAAKPSSSAPGTDGKDDSSTTAETKDNGKTKTSQAAVKIENGSAKLPKAPAIKHADFEEGKNVVVVVDKANTQTYLLQERNGEVFIVYEADNGIGTSESPTPPGPYTVVSKSTQPTWIPPKSIDPKQKKIGPYNQNRDNPLGVAEVRLNKWSIVLHGTNSPGSIGSQASHGCIRHRNDDIMRIFKAVKQGTTVLVVDSLVGTKVNKSMFES